MSISNFLFPLAAYLIGSIPWAIIVSKLFSLTDPREVGSGNPGATNVLRSGNKLAAAITLIADLLKGFAPVFAASYFGMSAGVIAVTAIAAFLGHLYPVYIGFKGGKGVATAIGVYLALAPVLCLIFAGTWLITALLSRYSSLSALMASAVTGLSSFAVLSGEVLRPMVGAVMFIVAFTFMKHRPNIERLTEGREPKIGKK